MAVEDDGDFFFETDQNVKSKRLDVVAEDAFDDQGMEGEGAERKITFFGIAFSFKEFIALEEGETFFNGITAVFGLVGIFVDNGDTYHAGEFFGKPFFFTVTETFGGFLVNGAEGGVDVPKTAADNTAGIPTRLIPAVKEKVENLGFLSH